MKTKELKKIAQRIISLEEIIEKNEDKEKVKKAKDEILELSGKISIDDMLTIDELIQKMLKEKNWLKKNFLI